MDERADTVWVVPDDVRQPGSLDGVLVADFSRVLAGPLATMILGDLGADVVKVEHPDGGDDTRAWGPPWSPDGGSSYYLGLNRNKRSVTLDLKDATDLDAATELARRADVVIENFRPGVMRRYGLDEPAVRATNPAVVSDRPRSRRLGRSTGFCFACMMPFRLG